MLFKDQLQFVWQHMKKNKLRVTTTVLAAMIGCAFLIVLASIGFGIQDTMRNEILNQEKITEIQLWGEEELSAEDKQWISGVEHVNVILESADINNSITSTLEDRTGYSQGRIIDMEAQAKLPDTLSEGRLPQAANEIVVGYHYAQSLLNEADQEEIERKSKEAEANGTWYNGAEEGYKGKLLGKEVSLALPVDEEGTLSEPTPFTIVGILKAPSYEWAQDTSIIFGKEVNTIFPQIVTYPSTVIHVDTLEHVMPVLNELKEEGYQVYSVIEQLEEMDLFFLIF
jgi:acetoin utilization transport system permease protein